jgi:hypothetical protein
MPVFHADEENRRGEGFRTLGRSDSFKEENFTENIKLFP